MVNNIAKQLNQLEESLSQQVVGQNHVVKSLLIALVADGHVLLEGLPGTAKTRSIRSLAKSLSVELGRVQFTPDLMPSDVVGYETANKNGDIVFKEGPAFTNILLADEINRAPPKVQSALLEAMEERQVTVGGVSHKLPPLFLTLATQNPIEQEGTYPLPEAQLDRFLLKVVVNYPDRAGELSVLKLVKGEEAGQDSGFGTSSDVIFEARKALIDVETSEEMLQYIVDIVMATRTPDQYPESKLSEWITVGSSPRATIALDKSARANALIAGKSYVDPDDIRSVVHGVLGHRIILSYDAIADGITTSDVVDEIIKNVTIV